jgi:hypothetical protein
MSKALLKSKYTELVCSFLLIEGAKVLRKVNRIDQGGIMFTEAILRRIKSVPKKNNINGHK